MSESQSSVSSAPMKPTVLLVDDDAPFCQRLARALTKRGYDFTNAASGAAGVSCAEQDSPELAVVNLRMPGDWGLRVVRELRRIDASTKIIVLTSYGSIAAALEAMRQGAAGYLQKPVTAEEVVWAFERVVGSETVLTTARSELSAAALSELHELQRVLATCGGDIVKAARQLGIHRRALERKLASTPSEE
jgi:two-component system, response regulator RegA